MIFLFQRIQTHYRLPVFERLNSELDGELVVACGQPAYNTYFRDDIYDNVSFKSIRLTNIWFGGERAVWQNFWTVFKHYGIPKAVICEHGPRILSSFPLLAYCKMRKIPFILWGHGGSRKRSISESGKLRDKIHRFLVRKSDAYICYTKGIKEELSKITKPEKLFVANNTLDTEELLEIRKQLDFIGIEKIKSELGLKKRFYMCFIGRLLESKRVDQAIEVYWRLRRNISDLGLIIIGDGPEKEKLESLAEREKGGDIIFTGEISEWGISAKYLYCSDLMIIPQSAGLAINHAFCFGLPVLTQENPSQGPFHGPEIEYVLDGKTGFICNCNNMEQMASCAEKIISQKSYFVDQVDKYCRQFLDLDTMVNGMISAIKYCL